MSSSSDSDVGERMRNLRYVLVKSVAIHREIDKQFAYKRKLGDLMFNANFETGNLGYVEQINMFDYSLMIRPDVANPRYRLWFNFSVSNQLPNQCVVFTFINFLDDWKFFNEGLTPVVRSRQEPNWLRLHKDQVFYYKSVNHDNHFVLSIAFKFSSYNNEHQFALFYPYSYTNLRDFITRWTVEIKRIKQSSEELTDTGHLRSACRTPDTTKHNLSSKRDDERPNLRSRSALSFRVKSKQHLQFLDDFDLKVDHVGTTILSKMVYQISIKSLSYQMKTPQVIICCRPCGNLDSIASLVCQGMMDFVLSQCSIARLARLGCGYTFFPMIDPDSICAGNSQSDIMGQSNHSQKLLNLNNGVYANQIEIRQRVEQICALKVRVVLIELRVNLLLIGSRVIGNHYDDECRMERHLAFPRLMARFSRDFYLENCEFKPKVDEEFPIFSSNLLSLPRLDHYRLEVSPFASYKRSLLERNYVEYTQKEYLLLGKAMIFALLVLLYPKEGNLPGSVRRELETFSKGPEDVDDLILKHP